MTGEAAAQICTSIAQKVRLLRAARGVRTHCLEQAVGQLLTAPATTTIDVLALSAMSRKLLSHVVGEFNAEELPTMEEGRASMVFALAFMERAIQTLETQTGYSAEGFTGESDAVN